MYSMGTGVGELAAERAHSGSDRATMLSRLPVMQPVGDGQLPVTSVPDVVRQHLQKRRYLASLETDEMDLFQKVHAHATVPYNHHHHTVAGLRVVALFY